MYAVARNPPAIIIENGPLLRSRGSVLLRNLESSLPGRTWFESTVAADKVAQSATRRNKTFLLAIRDDWLRATRISARVPPALSMYPLDAWPTLPERPDYSSDDIRSPQCSPPPSPKSAWL